MFYNVEKKSNKISEKFTICIIVFNYNNVSHAYLFITYIDCN